MRAGRRKIGGRPAGNRPGHPHRVVVIGGGFAGLQAVRGLRKADVEVTLVDRRNFHLFQPLLYQVASGALSAGEIASRFGGFWPVSATRGSSWLRWRRSTWRAGESGRQRAGERIPAPHSTRPDGLPWHRT